MQKNKDKKAKEAKNTKDSKAFIFTTDAFFALPLVILAISTFVAFSVTLRDNITLQEYSYTLAKDALNILIETSPANVNGTQYVSFAYLIINYTTHNQLNLANQTAGVLDSLFPINAGYILEYRNSSSNEWNVIRVYNPNKFNQYTIQVSNSRVVSAISDYNISTVSSCPSQIVCGSGLQRYIPGKVMGPIILRIRVFL